MTKSPLPWGKMKKNMNYKLLALLFLGSSFFAHQKAWPAAKALLEEECAASFSGKIEKGSAPEVSLLEGRKTVLAYLSAEKASRAPWRRLHSLKKQKQAALRRQTEAQLRNTIKYIKSVQLKKATGQSAFVPDTTKLLEGIGKYLERDLSEQQKNAFFEARLIGQNTEGNYSAYSEEQLEEKRTILAMAGFSEREIEKLMENGAVEYGFKGMDWIDPLRVMFFQNFHKGNINDETRYFTIKESVYNKSGDQIIKYSIGKIIKKLNDHKALAELIADRELKEIELDMRDLVSSGQINSVQQGSPELELVFRALKSDTEIIESLPVLPPSKEKESQRLEAQGYGPAFSRGAEETEETILLKEIFIEEKANPYKTHIKYYARKVRLHIEHIRKGIQPGDRKAMEALESLEKQAEEAIQEKRVTYKWWVEFNHKLVQLISAKVPLDSSLKFYSSRVEALISSFPAQILAPTIIGEAGIMAINNAGAHGIHVKGLINQEKMADGKLMTPEQFSAHDTSHAHVLVYNLMNTYAGLSLPRFYFRLKKDEGLTTKKRKNIEIIYLIMAHEGLGQMFIYKPPERIKELAISSFKTAEKFKFNFRGLKKFSPDPEQKSRQIEIMAEDFEEAFISFTQTDIYH